MLLAPPSQCLVKPPSEHRNGTVWLSWPIMVLRIVKPIDEAALVELANKARLYDVFYSQFGQFGVLQCHQPLCITQPIERRIRFASERQQLILIALLNQRRVAHSEVLHDALQNNGFIRRRDNERETFG